MLSIKLPLHVVLDLSISFAEIVEKKEIFSAYYPTSTEIVLLFTNESQIIKFQMKYL